MFFDSQLYPKIPIWENKRRIKLLIAFGNALSGYRQSYDGNQWSELRSFINRNLNAVHAVIHLAGVPTLVTQFGSTYDILANVFRMLEAREPFEVFDTIERAIGVYENNQKSAWFRTLWPFFWIGLFVDWISRIPFKILGVRNIDRGIARVIQKFFSLVIWLIGLTASVFGIVEFLGMQTAALKLLHLK